MVDAELDFLSSIPEVCTYIKEEVSKLRPRKLQIQQQVELAVQTSGSSLLCACSVQLVGSVSWGGEVPQSDLDMMLCSTDTNNDRNTAIFLLQELCSSLQEQSKSGGFEWRRLELMDSARIPILFVEDSEGCRCDIGVDQLQALYHRDFLLETLESQRHIGDLVRLVKFWVRQRGLPLASEGGLPSLAWVFAAVCLADGQPEGTSLEVLLMHFFSEMCQLLSHRLQVLPCSAHGWRTFWLEFDKPNPWHKEWIHSLQVMDPSDPHGQSVPEITSHRMPTALVSLYVAELRMAWSAIREGQWNKVWQPVTQEAAASLLSALTHPQGQGAPIHVVLKDGTVVAGTVEEQGCQGDLSAKDLQRRDHSLQLHLQPCKVDPKGTFFLLEHKLVFHPSQWICALPTSEIHATKGVALSRVAEIAEMLGVAQTSHGLHGIVAMLKYRPMQIPMAVPGCYVGMVWGCPMVTGQGQREPAESSFTQQHKQVQRTLRKVFDKFGDLESEESTRASDNESHSSTRSLQISLSHERAKHGYNRNATNRSTSGMELGQDTVTRSTKSSKKNQKLATTRQEAETRGDAKK